MMKIDKTVNDGTAIVSLEGRLDTISAPRLAEELKEILPGVTELVFDFKGLEYISSAGLRVMLFTSKVMENQGSMVVRNVSKNVMDTLKITNFLRIITVEQ